MSAGSAAEARTRVLVSGRVQGVAFRDSARRKAEQLGLRGWVRNLGDGRVEAVFEGPSELVADALAWCRKGPPTALVQGLETHAEQPSGDLDGFRVRLTAAGPDAG